MDDANSAFHFPPTIELTKAPLVEAWLEIKWQLQPNKSAPGSIVDPDFPFALGVFFDNIRTQFGHREELPLSSAPFDAFPYAVRYKFVPDSLVSPILQLGPGVATVNYTKDYTWQDFKATVLYLRENLIKAYPELKVQSNLLRYRNVFPFDHSNHQLFDFLNSHLNLEIKTSAHIPGSVALSENPKNWHTALTYDLIKPVGQGSIQLGKGFFSTDGKPEQNPVLILDLEVQSQFSDVVNISHEKKFTEWMESAHAIIHEWFFAFIDGKLRKTYETGNHESKSD